MSQLTASNPIALFAATDEASPSRAARWTGRVLSALPAAFLLLDAVMKFVKPEPVLKGTTKVENISIRNENHLINLISSLNAGQRIRMQVWRARETTTLDAVVGDWAKAQARLRADAPQ